MARQRQAVRLRQDQPFKGRQFTAEVIMWAVRWYLMFPISYRDLELMLLLSFNRRLPGCAGYDLAASKAAGGDWGQSPRGNNAIISQEFSAHIPVACADQPRECQRIRPDSRGASAGNVSFPKGSRQKAPYVVFGTDDRKAK